MKRLIILFILITIIASGALAKKELSDEHVIELTYNFTSPVIGKHNEYDTVEIYGLKNLHNAGKPEVPFRTAFILIPFASEVVNITVVAGSKKFIGNNFYLKPASAMAPIGFNRTHKTKPDPIIYTSPCEFPGNLYSAGSIQNMRGYRFLILNLHPVRYVPMTGELFYFENMTLIVRTKQNSRLISNSKNSGENTADRNRIVEIIDNRDSIEILNSYSSVNKLQGESIHQYCNFVNNSPVYDYVIITNNFLNSSNLTYTFQDLAEWKEQKGIKTIIITTERIYANCNGSDSQSKIRNFIRDAHSNWNITYILLGGDDEIIPHRGFYCNVYGLFLGDYINETDTDIPADMYYSNLDGSFDYNNNSLYAEPDDGENGGEVDLFSEVYVGRAPVSTPEDVSNFVRKTIKYENSTNDYLKKALMLGEWLSDDPGNVTPPGTWGKGSKEEVRFGSDKYNLNSSGFFNYFEIDALYDRDLGKDGWNSGDLIQKINDGVHIINHLGHASWWIDLRMKTGDLSAITNTDYFFGYSQGCIAGAFNCPGYIENVGSCDSDAIVEHFLKTEYGAFAFIANSRYGLATDTGETDGPSQFHDRMFFNEIFGENNTNIGKANQHAKESLAELVGTMDGGMRWVYYNVNLLGDPETRIHIDYSLILMPDFVVMNVTVIPKNPVEYDNVTITAAFGNRGNVNLNLSNVNVSLFVNDIYENSEIINLTNITEKGVNFSWNAAAGNHNLTIIVDRNNGIYEFNEENNNLTKILNVFNKCDLNRDGIYTRDYSDLMTAYKCFLGIERNCKINYRDWAGMKTEYLCFVDNKQ